MFTKKENLKRLLKFFIIFFIIIFFVFNWKSVSLFSNYKVLWHNFSNLFKNEEIRTPEIEAVVEIPIEKNNTIEIPKINVSAPIVISNDKKTSAELKKLLDSGVLLYPDYPKPGENGTSIILGHSAPPGWPNIKYENIFSSLENLQTGDEIIVYFNNKKYVFTVFDKKIILPEQEGSTISQYNKKDESDLVLITCWPSGKDYKRLLIMSKLLKQ